MQKLIINLENCYGIKKLQHEFNFLNFRTFIIYASNGVMKTSFAKTFKSISNGERPCDLMDEALPSTFNLFTDSSETPIIPQEICVIPPYNEVAFNSEGKILTLLADEKTRKEYLDIFNEIESLKKSTISALKKISGSSNYESEIIETFSYLEKKNIFEVFDFIMSDVKASKDSFDFKYNDVFDKSEKVKDFLAKNLDLLKQYLDKYNDLISSSEFFSKDEKSIFGTTEANNLGKSLAGDEYFFAGHKLVLKSHGDVSDKERLSDIIEEEIKKVFSDAELKQIFDKIDKALDANKELQTFKGLIERDNSILVRLSDYEALRRDVWFSFLKQIEAGLQSLVDLYNEKKNDLERIIKAANDGQSEWEQTILEFENRFVGMPFTVHIHNRADAVLNEQMPAIYFKFYGRDIERTKLVQSILSQGEKRAFYLLNVIFEIKSRQLQGKKTLFVIDDIADSFDYKNKYAIVEYLNDLSKESLFYSVILTHNFDFFRTLQSRILTDNYKRSHSFIAERLSMGIKLVPAGDKKNTDPFRSWRTDVNTNEKYLIACIPFVRNLIDFKAGEDVDYLLLTHVLHRKVQNVAIGTKATIDISIRDLEHAFSSVLSDISFDFEDNDKKIVDVIDTLIIEIKAQSNVGSIALEDKIILAIGVRLKAEEYMWSKIADKTPIAGSQWGKLYQKYKETFKTVPEHKEVIKILESVNIMTPENIHLNSFMYEPILDMGIDELKNLHDRVLGIFD